MQNKIYFLDYMSYPNAQLTLKELQRYYDITEVNMKDPYQVENVLEDLQTNPNSFYFTLLPKLIDDLNNLGLSSKSVINCPSSEDLRNLKESLISANPDLFISRIKLTLKDIDPMKMIDLIKESPDHLIKVQIKKGKPFFLRYEGMRTLNELNNINLGFVTPVSSDELENPETKTDYIVQAINGKFFMLEISQIGVNSLSWFEVKKKPVPKNILDAIKTEKTSCFFMYLKSLDKFRISIIHSGICHHVSPKDYIQNPVNIKDLSLSVFKTEYIDQNQIDVIPFPVKREEAELLVEEKEEKEEQLENERDFIVDFLTNNETKEE